MIPVYDSWIGDEELAQLTDVVRSNWVTEGPKTSEFQLRVASYCGVKHAIAVSNCTVGLYVALKALDIGDGDEVIVPDFTFIATANSVKMAGATPVFVDVDRRTFNIHPDSVLQAITSKTKALMPVHIYGQAADMDKICEIAAAKGLYVIEDAAEGMGVKWNGKHVGGFGDIGCLSFYGNKTITTGEGGMILTNNDKLAEKSLLLKNHGRLTSGTFLHEHIGYNFRITDMQSALGIAQLLKIGEIIRRKQNIESLYRRELSEVADIQFPYFDIRCQYIPWFVNILVDNPQAVGDFLADEGVGTRRFFLPLHEQPSLHSKGKFPNSIYAYGKGLSLPSSPLLTEGQVKYICKKLKTFYGA